VTDDESLARVVPAGVLCPTRFLHATLTLTLLLMLLLMMLLF